MRNRNKELFIIVDIQSIKIKKQVLHLSKYREEVDRLMQDYPHAWWIGLSYRGSKWEYPFTEDVQVQGVKMLNAWLNHMASKYEAHFESFKGVEPLSKGGRFSTHVVLLSDRFISINDLKKCWKHGFTYVRPYKPTLGGIEYIYKGHLGVQSWKVCSGKGQCRITRKGKVLCKHRQHRETEV